MSKKGREQESYAAIIIRARKAGARSRLHNTTIPRVMGSIFDDLIPSLKVKKETRLKDKDFQKKGVGIKRGMVPRA